MEAMRVRSTKQKKEDFLKAYSKSWNITRCCEMVGIDRGTYYFWLHKDKAFEQKVINADEEKKDFVEDALFKKIKAGDTTAIIFTCKTKLKDRGYIEKQEIINKVSTGQARITFVNASSDGAED